MAQYTNLNAPPEKSLRDIVAGMKAETRQSKTGAAGVKDLGAAGDVLWLRPDGGAVSVRDVDLDLADARQRLEEAETSLTDTGSRLTAAEQAVQDVRDELANIEVGGGGPLIHDRIPAPSDGEDKPAGTAWLVYGQDGTLTSVWQWDGAVWEEMPLDATLIPVLDIGSGTFGDLEGARLVVDDTLSARVVQAMSAEAKELVVTESAVLNHVTAIGQTVVDDINVQGKLIGTDGVFTGTVDFANINVTDEILAARISGEYLYGTVIEGGEIRTSDALPGQVAIRDDGYVDGNSVAYPGIRVTPTVTHNPNYPPGIGANASGLTVTGGTSAGGDRAFVSVQPDAVILRSRNEGAGRDSQMYATATEAVMYSMGATGTRGSIRAASTFADVIVFDSVGEEISSIYATSSRAGIAFGQGSDQRFLNVDSDGVWARSGGTKVSLIPQVRQFQYSSQWNADQSPAHIMVQHLPGGKLCQAQIRIQNLSGSSLSLPNETWVTLNYNPIPADLRGGFTDYIEVTLPQLSARGRVEMNYSTGSIRIRNVSGTGIAWTNNNSIWFPMRWFSPD